MLPKSVPPVVTSCQENCKRKNNETEYAMTESNGIELNIVSRENYSRIGTLAGGMKCHNSVLSDLTLAKCSDCKVQHIVNFLEELDSYFQLKAVPVGMKLPPVIKSIRRICTMGNCHL